MASTGIVFEHDEERQTFGAKIEKDWVELEYRANREGKFFITGLNGPPRLINDGVGNQLIEHALNHVRDNGFRLIPSCKSVKDYLKEHPEYLELVASGIRIR
jgi:hypothetical protein